ncbi:MAG: KH domain-containing protein [Erysipelotrichaceae bacterium]|nr:KH domain-containing protein [Erysipelotrichaceae bacterium]
MINYEKVLFDLIEPMVDDVNSVSIQKHESVNENEVVIYIYAKSDDIARLIGRQGAMATAIRQVMSIASRLDDCKVTIKFESFES